MARTIARGWPGFRTLATGALADEACAALPFASILRVSTEAIGSATDVGLELLDCGGWSVEQWHAQGPDPRIDVHAALVRMRLWANGHPRLAINVFDRGIAYDPATSGPTYFYVLFKTSYGNMRVLARPGGPAWLAGLRTNDIVDKVDGHYWWEYGTYQTQIKAYDGLPHSFDVSRGERHGIHVVLGEPFDAASP